MLVVDASIVAPAVTDGGPDGDVCRRHISGQSIAAPDLLRIETMSVIRRFAANDTLTSQQANNAVSDLLDLPIATFPTAPLLQRCWELRKNVTAYDACYVALAEALGCPLITADAHLARAPGPRCQFTLV